jgi:iron-regulated transporter 1
MDFGLLFMNDEKKIILSRALTNSGDQAWDFAVPVTLAMFMPGHLDLVALVFFLSRLSHVLILPLIGNMMDKLNRVTSIKLGLCSQFIGVLIQAIALTHLSESRDFSLLFIIFGGVISGLGSAMTNIAVSQDIVPLLFQGDLLSKINSRIRQVDLFSEVCSPVVAGTILLLNTSSIPYAGILIIALWNLASFFPEYFLVRSVFSRHKEKLQRPSVEIVKIPIWSKLSMGWGQLLKISAAPAIFAYALLWLSALSPHGVLLTSFLKESWALPEITLGIFRGLGAIFGLFATILFPIAVAKIGLVKTCRLSILLQSITLIFALAGFHLKFSWLFLGGILFSRIGLYSFSLGEQQLRQLSIPEHLRGSINATATALTSLATLCLLGLGSILGSVDQFARLVDISVGCVLVSCFIIYRSNKLNDSLFNVTK